MMISAEKAGIEDYRSIKVFTLGSSKTEQPAIPIAIKLENQKKKGWHTQPAFRVEAIREGPKKT
jgi:hypothetical protein